MMLMFKVEYTKSDTILQFLRNFVFVYEADTTLFAKLILEITTCTIMQMSGSG